MRRFAPLAPALRFAAAAVPAILFATSAAATTITLAPTDDAHVASNSPTSNYGSTTGVFVAAFTFVDLEYVRFLLKFDLPAYAPGTSVTSAILSGTVTYSDLESAYSLISVVGDGWDESSVNWNNQPLDLVTTSETLVDVPGPYPVVEQFDLTPWVDQEYQGDGVLSLRFRIAPASGDPGSSVWQADFASKENTSLAGFSLQLTIVPEPSTAAVLALGVVLMGRSASSPARREATPQPSPALRS